MGAINCNCKNDDDGKNLDAKEDKEIKTELKCGKIYNNSQNSSSSIFDYNSK